MKNWKSVLVNPSTPIRKVLEIIDASSMQIALVVDAKNRLLGTVTDGDVRRGILRGVSLDVGVNEIMKTKPVVARSDEAREIILDVMRKKQIRKVPILDDEDRVIGVESLEDLTLLKAKENIVVLMAGGLGSRLRPLTDDCPKPLLKVGLKPILETILENFIEYGFQKFYISVNYKDAMVKEHFGDGSRWDVRIEYLHESQKLGTAGSLSLLPVRPKKPILVMNGDLLTKVNFDHLLDFHAEHGAAATMCVREYDFQVPYGVVKIEKNQVKGIDEKPVQRFFVNAGIYVMDPSALKWVPKNTAYDMPHFFEKLIQKKQSVAAFPIREYWLDIGRMDDMERAEGEFKSVFQS